jgi:hypothetical protein
MEKEIENIIKSKRYLELNESNRELIKEWVSNEDEFNQLKSVFLATDVFKNEQVSELNPTVKQRLDVRFKEKYDKERLVWYNKLWVFLWPEDVSFIKKPLLQLAAVGMIVIMVTPFLLQNNTSQKRLAAIDTPLEEKSQEVLDKSESKKEDDQNIDESLREQEKVIKTIDDIEETKVPSSEEIMTDVMSPDIADQYPVMQSASEELVYEMSDEAIDLEGADDGMERLNEEQMMKRSENDQDDALFAGIVNKGDQVSDRSASSKDSKLGTAGYSSMKRVDPVKTIDLLTALY